MIWTKLHSEGYIPGYLGSGHHWSEYEYFGKDFPKDLRDEYLHKEVKIDGKDGIVIGFKKEDKYFSAFGGLFIVYIPETDETKTWRDDNYTDKIYKDLTEV